MLGVLLAALVLISLNTWLAIAAYRDAVEQASFLEQITTRDPATLSVTDLGRIEQSFDHLGRDLRRLDRATSLPLGKQVIGRVPWVAPRYLAVRDLLRSGSLLADAGETAASIGRDTLLAFEATGVSSPSPMSDATWLDVIVNHEAELDHIIAAVEDARVIRSRVDDDVLPEAVRVKLAVVDRILSDERLIDEASAALPALEAGFGAHRPVRYLVLFQNPAELRPSGGFPGTMGLVTVARGQLVDHTFFPGNVLTVDYVRQREAKLPQPMGIAEYFRQDGFLLHDANWYADFPRSGAQIVAMYAETDWPPIDGVVAIVPDVVGDLLQITGPITLEVDGLRRQFTPERIHEQIEVQRLRQVSEDSTTHKELVGLLGEEILARLISADRASLSRAAASMIESANRRDIQVFSSMPEVQAVLDAQRWSGRLVPDPNIPTVAMTFANVALGKSSLLMHSHLTLTLRQPEHGLRDVDVLLKMEHTGSEKIHPFYAGFQKWWIDVTLPYGSTRSSSSAEPVSDPDSPNGGSYVVDLPTEQSAHLKLSFSMPDNPRLLLRRQPGLTPMRITIRDPTCGAALQFTLEADATLNIDDLCPGSAFAPASPQPFDRTERVSSHNHPADGSPCSRLAPAYPYPPGRDEHVIGHLGMALSLQSCEEVASRST